MPDGKDEELLRYYPRRRAWILDDDGRVTLRPLEAVPHGRYEEVLRYHPERRAWILDGDEKVTLRPLEAVPRETSPKNRLDP
jgi:hypothetical protein